MPVDPKVSVIIPVYNARGGLARAVASVLAQTYEGVELILVDDGSTDGSSDLCEQIASEDDRIVVLHKSNGGVSTARNLGIANATGDYLTFVDADDALVPGALAKVVQRLVETGAELACFGMTFVYQDGVREIGRTLMSVDLEMSLEDAQATREQFFYMFERNYLSSVWNKVFRTDFVRTHKLQFDSRLAVLEDLDYVVRALTEAPRVVVLPDTLYEYLNVVSIAPASRRPDIDYLQNFRLLEASLDRMAEALGMATEAELNRLNTMVFRFYLIGMELLFARRLSHWERYRQLKEYSSSDAVVVAAHKSARSRRGVDLAATCVKRRGVFRLYLVLLGSQGAKKAKNAQRIIAARARTFVRR